MTFTTLPPRFLQPGRLPGRQLLDRLQLVVAVRIVLVRRCAGRP